MKIIRWLRLYSRLNVNWEFKPKVMNTKVLLVVVFIFPFSIAQGQGKNAIQIGPALGFTPYESSMGLGVWGMYSRNLTRNFELFISGSSVSGSYTTVLPNYTYDNSEKVFAWDLGASFDLTPEKDNNRLLLGIGGSWVQVQYDFGEFVYSDRVEMNRIRY